jgi:hypothetical protein
MCWALGVGRGLEMLSVTNQEDIVPVPAQWISNVRGNQR